MKVNKETWEWFFERGGNFAQALVVLCDRKDCLENGGALMAAAMTREYAIRKKEEVEFRAYYGVGAFAAFMAAAFTVVAYGFAPNLQKGLMIIISGSGAAFLVFLLLFLRHGGVSIRAEKRMSYMVPTINLLEEVISHWRVIDLRRGIQMQVEGKTADKVVSLLWSWARQDARELVVPKGAPTPDLLIKELPSSKETTKEWRHLIDLMVLLELSDPEGRVVFGLKKDKVNYCKYLYEALFAEAKSEPVTA
jgi:hypothetical protein